MQDTVTISRELLRQVLSDLVEIDKARLYPVGSITALRTLLDAPAVEQEPETDWKRIALVQDAKLRAVTNEPGGFERLCIVMDAYEKQHSCKWPTCQTEQYQKDLGDQVAKELFGVVNEFNPDWDQIKPFLDRIAELEAQQPRKAVKLTTDEVAAIVKEAAKGGAMRRDGSTSERIARAVEQAVWVKLGVTE